MHEQSSKTSKEMGCSVQGKINRPGQFRIGRQGQRVHKYWKVVFILGGSWLIIPFLQGKSRGYEKISKSRMRGFLTWYEILERVFTKTQIAAMMKAVRSPEDDTTGSSRTPLIPIGVAIITVLMVPVFLYSIGPEGPLKVGDVVFTTDRHRVKFLDSNIPQIQGYQDFCILESRVQLVVQAIDTMSGSPMVAEPIGIEKIEVPYCPPRTSVLLQPYQATLKADIWGGLRDTLSNLVSGR